tara:strand:+ start:223 stop:1254 length:1032 start_codon:yes stop_codon:yes gene_type:complete
MSDKNLIIINNEKIFKEDNNFYCDNLDQKVLCEGLNKYHKVQYIARESSRKGGQKIELGNIKVASNIFKFTSFIFKTLKISETSYLLISITPYTFLSFLILFLFRKKKIFVYLFSSGHEEYKHILGSWSVWIYHIMYKIVTSNSKVLVCDERLYKKKSHIINASRLNDEWFVNHKKALLDKVRFFYVGRMNPEKGIFSFLKMFNEIKFDAKLSIIGNSKNQKISNNKVELLGYISDPKLLINAYDNHNIMVLPSYTEGTPYIVDESLARKRPIIIFEDIAYIVKEKIGIFISKRDVDSFSKTTKYIMDNYIEIQKKMEKNVLPTRNNMIKQISDILSAKTINN